ncbi:PD40 domain-containing protein [bacterium]|nr:PD40 domain-containing protein [bacterium]
MKRCAVYLYWVLVPAIGLSCYQDRTVQKVRGPYLGQNPPGDTPVLFAPGIVSTGLDELNNVFSPDGSEFYFCVRNQLGMVSIFCLRETGSILSEPELLPFASAEGDIDVTLSPDGSTLLFSSRRALPGSTEPKLDNDFWMARRSEHGWNTPVHLGAGINSESEDYYAVMAGSGTIYFSSQREGPGTNNIYRSPAVNGVYQDAEKLGPAVNTEYREFDPYIAPDESFLIFASDRPGGQGASDLYVCFQSGDGGWTDAVNMGSTLNSAGSEYCPMLSPDGLFLFFTAARRESPTRPEHPATYDDFRSIQNGPGYLFSDIYWVDAGIIERLGAGVQDAP